MDMPIVQYGGPVTGLWAVQSYCLPGEPVRMRLFLQNRSPFPVTLFYPSSQRYDFLVSGMTGKVWQWSEDRFFNPAVTQVDQMPGQVLDYYEEWPLIDSAGNPVPPGIYRITGWSTFAGSASLPKPFVFVTVCG